jgi:hypothetical protein
MPESDVKFDGECSATLKKRAAGMVLKRCKKGVKKV